MAGVIIKGLYKEFRIKELAVEALAGVNLNIPDGSFITIVGKSGCGKTTLLRILSGLEEKTRGEIVFYSNERDSREDIRVGMVFQEPRLMPWMTIEQNIAFSLIYEEDKNHIKGKVNDCLQMLGLTGFKDAYPCQISGGMAQRAALGRTLCYGPDLILMDEPLGALDAFNRRKLQDELLDIFKKDKKTVVFVTHDVDEAVYLGQRVVVMDNGRAVDEIDIDLAYPRITKSKRFFELREEILRTVLERERTI